jgi:hypothetical protein
MKVKDVEVGQIFNIDLTNVRPKLKLKKGFVDMASLYVYEGKDDVDAFLLTESQIIKVRNNWRMTEGKFNDFKEALIRRYIKEVEE